jgi:hypothetical protein
MLDDRFEDRLREAARGYNEPPETPREAMWAAIQARRAEAAEQAEAGQAEGMAVKKGIRPFSGFRRFGPVRVAAGVAALLALGFGLGRLTRGSTPIASPEVVASVARPRGNEAYRITATDHLSQSEAFLTLFRTSLRRGGNEQLASATARELLATNRLLLDSPAATDARTRLLLQDLELVLAEIAQLSPEPRSRDLDLIEKELEQGGVLSRLRTAVPSGPSTTQGAL